MILFILFIRSVSCIWMVCTKQIEEVKVTHGTLSAIFLFHFLTSFFTFWTFSGAFSHRFLHKSQLKLLGAAGSLNVCHKQRDKWNKSNLITLIVSFSHFLVIKSQSEMTVDSVTLRVEISKHSENLEADLDGWVTVPVNVLAFLFLFFAHFKPRELTSLTLCPKITSYSSLQNFLKAFGRRRENPAQTPPEFLQQQDSLAL